MATDHKVRVRFLLGAPVRGPTGPLKTMFGRYNMKRILSFFLAILLCFVMIIPTTLAEDEIVDLTTDTELSEVIEAPVDEISEPLAVEVDLDEIV